MAVPISDEAASAIVLAESFNFLMNFGARGVGGATSTGFTSILVVVVVV
jgi:hypothetical protein